MATTFIARRLRAPSVLFWLCGLWLWLVGATATAREVPAMEGRVNDLAGVLDVGSHQRLEQLLAAHEKATGHQFAVLIVPSLEGDPLEDFSIRVVESWKLGAEKEDDGLLVLVAMQERKIRIEVGYGLEGEIPDARAGRVISNVMRPHFRRGEVGGGIEEGLIALMRATGWSPPAAGRREARRTQSAWDTAGEPRQASIGVLVVVFFLTAVLTFFVPVLAIVFWIAAFGGLTSFFGGGILLPLFLGMMVGGIGRRFSSNRTGWWAGGPWIIGGGGWGSSGGLGGGGSFGGFSGGGGGFGGGGASGGW